MGCIVDKICRICGEVKPLILFYFRKDSTSYRSECKVCLDVRNTKRNIKNIEKIKAYNKEYWKTYGKKNKDKRTKAERDRKHNNIQYRIASNLRSRLYCAIRFGEKKGSAVMDLGCSIKELMKHLETKFDNKMTWDNYGRWHIDHIIPLCSFDLTDETQLKVACHYLNLQPLWAQDNLSKGTKIV